MVRRASCASPDDASHRRENHEAPISPVAILRDALRAPQDEDLFLGAVFFFFATGFFLTAGFLTTAFFTACFAALRAFGRLRNAARCAAASADLAHTLRSSESSNSRAGNCQYEFTVTVLVRVW